MERRRSTWAPAVRLALLLSVIAVAAAVGLHSAGLASETVIVLGVIAVCFATSWVRTFRHAGGEHHDHRVVTVPVRGIHAG